jgi:hypothetical protein
MKRRVKVAIAVIIVLAIIAEIAERSCHPR